MLFPSLRVGPPADKLAAAAAAARGRSRLAEVLLVELIAAVGILRATTTDDAISGTKVTQYK